MKTSEFYYNLPEELIAQHPLKERDTSKMMVLNKNDKTIEHKTFSDIVDLIDKDTMIVINNTKVFPARLVLKKRETGAKIEVFLLKNLNLEKTKWKCLIKPSKRVKVGTILAFPDNTEVLVTDKFAEGIHNVEIKSEKPFEAINKFGKVPLPPYIKRDDEEKEDKDRYQTVFAKQVGAVAAPTAGFHFTESVIDRLKAKGIPFVQVTLFVGLGTFRPVSVDTVENHKMDSERYFISNEAAKSINDWKANGGKILAVGTTAVRTLEGCFAKYGKLKGVEDETDIFIYPPYEFKVVDKLLTNFHLPESTLIMLVSAFAGKDFVLKAYDLAVKNKYRFYSYGDCMLIL